MGRSQTLSNFEEVQVSHVHLNLSVDFSGKRLTGYVDLDVAVLTDSQTLKLDTRDLDIQKVTAQLSDEELKFDLGAPSEAFGSQLTITLPADSQAAGSNAKVRVQYATSPNATAIQWLTPEQTLGKKHPYLFTQCQAIHARSLVPCMDHPAAKLTYSSSITVPSPLVALMSALKQGEGTPSDDNTTITHKFDQPVKIPSYLIALVVGDLKSRTIGPRTDVWCEEEMVDKAAWEFDDTERYIQIAESLVGPYEWTRYDLLMLPPSFPYGGMENPCLTFVTPTLIAGDRSLSDVVAHEISHSWSGNLVTNSSWEDFWMNEGLTTFLERKIKKALHGEDAYNLSIMIGWARLKRSVYATSPGFNGNGIFTKLIPEIDGIDPDDAFSTVPYEKGFALLLYLESIVGEKPFQEFLKAHIQRRKFALIESNEWKEYFKSYFAERDFPADKLAQIDWDAWYHGVGMPPVDITAQLDRSSIDATFDLASAWTSVDGDADAVPGGADAFKGWIADQQILCLDRISETVSELISKSADNKEKVGARIRLMDKTYELSKSQNAEILFRLYMNAVAVNYSELYDEIAAFVSRVGRMKFARPLYKALFENGATKDLAVNTFGEHRNEYHPIGAKMIAKDMKLV